MEKFHALRIEKVLPTFHIKKNNHCHELQNWTSGDGTISEVDNIILGLALDRYARLSPGWNEEELKMHFISPILNVADPNIEFVCKTFFERPLSGIIGNYELNIITDCMIASYNEGGFPMTPYFFLQERNAARFKQAQLWGKTDPQGQMLAAMLLAQEQNQDGKYLYGCYVIERHWYFTTLLASDYCVSPAYDSTKKDDLLQIVYILRKLKELILMRNT